MSLSRSTRVLAVTGLAVLVLGGVAFASSAPLPKRGSAYTTGGSHATTVSLTLVVSHASARKIDAGPASPPIGSQFALSVGSVRCPRAPRNPGLSKKQQPFGLFSFPGAHLRRIHGSYGFSVTKTVANESLLGSSAAPFKLTVAITGKVTSATTIKGKIRITGGPCTIGKPVAYRAVFDSKLPVAPGA